MKKIKKNNFLFSWIIIYLFKKLKINILRWYYVNYQQLYCFIHIKQIKRTTIWHIFYLIVLNYTLIFHKIKNHIKLLEKRFIAFKIIFQEKKPHDVSLQCI